MGGQLKGMLLNVSGVVQGVGFRWWAKRVADGFGVKGYVRNLFDGSVEIYAESDESTLQAFYEQVKIGPRYADISHVRLEWQEYKGTFKEFRIGL